jgi:hypothetical protein
MQAHEEYRENIDDWEAAIAVSETPTEVEIIPWNDDEFIQLDVVRVACTWEGVGYDDNKHLMLKLFCKVLSPVNEGKCIRIDLDISPDQKYNPKFGLGLLAYGGDGAAIRFALEADGKLDWSRLCGLKLETKPRLKKNKSGDKVYEYYYQSWRPAGTADANH